MRRVLVLATAAATISACTSWRVQPVSPAQLLDEERPERVRVQRSDRSRVVLNAPQLVPDSLVGTSRGERTSLPLADIAQIEVRRGSTGKTIGLVLGLTAVTAVVCIPCTLLVVCSIGDCSELGH